MIKKPFRFLKHVLRWFERDAENILVETRQAYVPSICWYRAKRRFDRRGLPIPIYENHDESKVIGKIHNIEARPDGLFVTAHEFNDRGYEVLNNMQYFLPSGDFVVYYNDKNEIVDVEVTGVSLVNNEAARDMQLVTQDKSNGHNVGQVKKSLLNSQEEKDMSNEEKAMVIEYLQNEEFITELPQDVIDLILKVRGGNKEEEVKEEVTESAEGEEEVKEETVEEGADGEEKEEEVAQSKEEIEALLREYGFSDEHIEKIWLMLEEDAGVDKEELEVELEDKIASKEMEDQSKALPSSVRQAKMVLKRNRDIMGKKALTVAFNEVIFVGGRKKESVTQDKDKSLGDVARDLLKY